MLNLGTNLLRLKIGRLAAIVGGVCLVGTLIAENAHQLSMATFIGSLSGALSLIFGGLSLTRSRPRRKA